MITVVPELWTAKNEHRSVTNYIVIHHAAARYQPGQAIRSIYNFHRSKWPDYGAAGYHVILQEEPDQSISVNLVNCPYIIAAGVARRNHETFHICLASDFTNTIPSQPWIDATRHAITYAQQLFPTAQIVGHRDIALKGFETACPGNRWAEWRMLLQSSPVVPVITEDDPIVGKPMVLSKQDIVRIVQMISARCSQQYTVQDVTTIVQGYYDLCLKVNMNAVVPIAQMLHETGWLTSFWSLRPQRNPAGIGVTGEWRAEKPEDTNGWAYNTQRKRWEKGISFKSWLTESIPAHVGRLLAYALTDEEAHQDQRDLIQFALSFRPLPERLRGKCKTLRDLNGTWAVPGNQYAQRIVAIANQLLKG